jgi:hypothetical protein
LSFIAATEACQKAKVVIFEALSTKRLSRYFLRESAYHPKGIEYHERTVSAYRRWGALKKASSLEESNLTSRTKHH